MKLCVFDGKLECIIIGSLYRNYLRSIEYRLHKLVDWSCIRHKEDDIQTHGRSYSAHGGSCVSCAGQSNLLLSQGLCLESHFVGGSILEGT